MFGPYFPYTCKQFFILNRKFGTALGRALKMLRSRIPNQVESGSKN